MFVGGAEAVLVLVVAVVSVGDGGVCGWWRCCW